MAEWVREAVNLSVPCDESAKEGKAVKYARVWNGYAVHDGFIEPWRLVLTHVKSGKAITTCGRSPHKHGPPTNEVDLMDFAEWLEETIPGLSAMTGEDLVVAARDNKAVNAIIRLIRSGF